MYMDIKTSNNMYMYIKPSGSKAKAGELSQWTSDQLDSDVVQRAVKQWCDVTKLACTHCSDRSFILCNSDRWLEQMHAMPLSLVTSQHYAASTWRRTDRISWDLRVFVYQFAWPACKLVALSTTWLSAKSVWKLVGCHTWDFDASRQA